MLGDVCLESLTRNSLLNHAQDLAVGIAIFEAAARVTGKREAGE
jgi:hypothetical protein